MTTEVVQSASGVFSLAWLLVALPLFGAAVLLLGGRRTNSWGHLLGVLMSVSAFVVGFVIFLAMLGKPAEERAYDQHLYDWIIVGKFQIPVTLHLDQLSMTFILLITFVGSLIHIYSIGYMAHDPDRRRFFAYLNLFVASMLLLVLANNYLLLYVGWEGVGLASYLLIGFWYYKPTAAVAAKKAFVVNRVGDMGLSIAIMIMFVTFGSVTFGVVDAGATKADSTTMTWIGLALLLAACGKSAQVPLQSWLFDAMEGPTPVSALIHAATMVTAGVYLIVRSSAIFDVSTTARNFVIGVGLVSLIFGAIIGSARDDIKKGLAGSTMSQIGYMVLAAGLGPAGYIFAIFQLVTHGFFKADLFLGAGSVLHGMKDQQNMRRFGALRALMVITFVTFIAGYLAIIGVPPFSAFYSKDDIVRAAVTQNWFAGLATLIGAAITAFYMTRMVIMTFYGKARWEEDQHPHESPFVMTIPMMVLAVGAAVAGFALVKIGNIVSWLEPVTGFVESNPPISETLLQLITLALVALGAFIAIAQYGRREVPVVAPTAVTPLTKAARVDLYGDAFNEAVFMRPGQYLTRVLVYFDNKIIDGAVNGSAALFGGFSGRWRRWQTGYVRTYALTMLAGVVGVIAALVLVRL